MATQLSRRVRRGFAVILVVAFSALSAGTVAADTGPVNGSFSQDGRSADGGSSDCVSNGDGTTTCSDLSLSIFVGTRSENKAKAVHISQLCVNASSYTYADETGELIGDYVSESGCRDDLSSRAIRFGAKLSSVTLAATTVAIGTEFCDKTSDPVVCDPGQTHPVRVAGTWTGVGPTTFSKYSSLMDDGTCRYASAEKSTRREATFAGTVDGMGFANGYASIADGKSSWSSKCAVA